MAKKPRKTTSSEKPPAKAAPEAERRVPAHGRGKLLTGGVPGNRGGGPPPSKVRADARQLFSEGLGELRRVARSKKESTRDRLRAIDIAGKYGLGQARGMDEEQFEATLVDLAGSVDARLKAVMPREEAEKTLKAIFADWKETIRVRRAAVRQG